jgi:hypothetical protein
LFAIGRDNGVLTRSIARILGVHEEPRMSRTMKRLVRDKAAFKKSVGKLRDLDVRRVILAHDQIIESNVERRLSDAFAWLD